MFLLKKILSQFLMPLPIVSILLLAAIVLLLFTRRRKAPGLLVGAVLLVILAGGNGFVADGVLRPLESRYPAFAVDGSEAASPGVRVPAFVVVLGGGHVSDPSLPLTSQVNEAAVIRVVEGIRLQRLYPGSKLVVSGGKVFDPLPSAKLMADLAVELGVPREEIIQVDQPMDTAAEARRIAPIVGDAPFLLVTCAAHMPRAVALFERAGTHPIPAPTHHLARKRQGPSLGQFFPSAYNLAKVERVIHERVGMVWARVRGEG
jgi:uncharacterized SAM-binding protein YcdF (DUF218 family)